MAWPKGLSRKFGKQEEPKAADVADAAIMPPAVADAQYDASVPHDPVETADAIKGPTKTEGIGAKLPVGMPSSAPNGTISRGTKPWEKNVNKKPWRRDITALTKKDRDNHCRW